MKLENRQTGQIEDVPMHNLGTTEEGETIYAPCNDHELPGGFYLDEDGNWVEEK